MEAKLRKEQHRLSKVPLETESHQRDFDTKSLFSILERHEQRSLCYFAEKY